ncbi:hypothetical protein H8356DRAFT_1323768 [Neocallimastix lanati (nom. inval.)]|nr:hypothetical protein H8356DRAFT_1323768 [Neocallimastix sp. JGI-2020a]
MVSFLRGDTKHMRLSCDHRDCVCKTQFCNNIWVRRANAEKLKLEKVSSNKSLCVYGCAAGEKSCYGC